MKTAYETQEPWDLGADIRCGRAAATGPLKSSRATLKQELHSGESPKFHAFYHAYNELYKRSYELLHFAQTRLGNNDNGLLGSLTDELKNQKECLAMFDEYLKNVWVCNFSQFLGFPASPSPCACWEDRAATCRLESVQRDQQCRFNCIWMILGPCRCLK